MHFGPHYYVFVLEEILDQVAIGDEVIVTFNLYGEGHFLTNQENFTVDKVEILSKKEESGVNVEQLKREDNEYNQLLAEADEKTEKIDPKSVKEVPYEQGDKRKLLKYYRQFAIANVVGIVPGIIAFPFGLLLSVICAFLMVMSIVKCVVDLLLNKKLLSIRGLKEIKEKKGKVIVELSRGKNISPFTKKFEKSEIDQYDLSLPVIVHLAPFSKKIIDITFKEKR